MAATAILWSIAGLFIKVIDWNPIAIAGSRSLIASAVILIYLRHPRIHLSFPQVAAAVANAATMLLFVSAVGGCESWKSLKCYILFLN